MQPAVRNQHRTGSGRLCIVMATACILFSAGVKLVAGLPVLGGPLPLPFPLFPSDNWWNVDISGALLDPGSAGYIAFINSGSVKKMHPDFGGEVSPGSVEIYGFPFIVVDGSQARVQVDFLYSGESDGVDHTTGRSYPFYPIPEEAKTQPHWIEGGPPGTVDLRSQSDRHMLIVDRDNRMLYELYNVYFDGVRWHGGSGACFDLKTNARRPEGWTSADAAGLAILPGLVRYDEINSPDEIHHAFRVTLRTTNGSVYPASHRAGATAAALPMGARLRMKASVDISRYQAPVQKIFRAMKKYGLIVADNGTDMYISGSHDTRWNNEILNPAFHSFTASDFEVIRLGYDPARLHYFPQIAIGGGYTTLFSISNTGSTNVNSGIIHLFNRAGLPLTAVINANSPAAVSSIQFNLQPGASQVFAASPEDSSGTLNSGWALLETQGGEATATATFQRQVNGRLQSVAGVFGSTPSDVVVIPVDNNDSLARYTGFAVANPSDTSISIRLSVFDETGALVDESRPKPLNPLPGRNQIAVFLHEYVDATRKFRGSMKLVGDGGSTFAAVGLQQVGGLLTAIPVLTTR